MGFAPEATHPDGGRSTVTGPSPSVSGVLPTGCRVRAVYVHSPFCARRCPYCDFAISPLRAGIPAGRYLDGLARELERRAGGIAPRTLFVGGGTPTALAPRELERFFALLATTIDRSRMVEFSVEANPEDVDEERTELLRQAGVTRVSLGAQSFQRDLLRRLGRAHEGSTIERAVRTLRGAGIPRINLDLIFGVPGQTEAHLEADLARAIALRPDHVSCYGLTFEPGTLFSRAMARGRMRPVDEERELTFYRRIRQALGAAGYLHYEVSNFARPGARCLHNLTYWRNLPHLGIGPSAVSYIGGARRRNDPDLARWCDRLAAGEDPVHDLETLPWERSLRETVMVGLRMRAGVGEGRLARRYGRGFEALEADALARLRQHGLITADEHRLRLTSRGLELADTVATELL